MIQLKEAMEIAKDFIIEINGEQENFQLEEISLSPDKKSWLVTYSYDMKIAEPNQLQKTLGLETRKVHKKIIIDSENKDILGMYNWSYENREAA